MPTLALDQITIGGPCKITDGTNVIYFEDAVKLTPQPVWRGIPSNVAGEQDDVLTDLVWKITGRPKSVWTSAYRTALLPSALTNFSTTGTPLLGTSNAALTVTGADSTGFTFTRAALTKMPNLFFGLGKSLYNSDVEWTAFCGHGKALTATDAFYALNTTAWDQSDFPSSHQEAMATLAWGAVTGWSNVFAEDGFMLTHESKLEAIKQGSMTVDMKVTGYRGMLAFNPQQPTTTQLLTAFNLQGASGGPGIRRSANAADAVITAGSLSFTLKSAGLRTGVFNFDNKLNRHGEFALVTALTTPGTRLVMS